MVLNRTELRAGWQWTTLGAIADPTRNRVNPQNYPELPFVGMEHVESHTRRVLETVPAATMRSTAEQFQPGDVLYGRMRPYLNKVFLADFHGLCSGEFIPFRKTAAVNSKYLLYFLNSWEFVSFASHLTEGDRPRVDFAQLAGYPFPLPPRPEQDLIVDIIETQFSRVDAAEAALKRVQANLRRYRAAVLRAACEGRLVPTEAELAQAEGRTYEPAATLLERILVERRAQWQAEHPGKKYKELAGPDVSTLPELPEGWCWASAEQLCYFITKGTTPSADKLSPDSGDVPFIKVYNLTFTGQLDFSINSTYISMKTHIGELARSVVVPGDVLMNIVGPPLGKVSIVPDTFPEWNINQAIARFRTVAPLNNRYLSICLQSESILNWATTRAKATAGQFNLTLEICRQLPIPLPPVNEQVRLASEVEARLSAAAHSERGLYLNFARSNRLRQSILQRAFSGQFVTLYSASEPSNTLATADVTPSVQQQLGFL
ncbi:MAG: restriction endonuclease subunit S [Caldilineaceae bacterium]